LRAITVLFACVVFTLTMTMAVRAAEHPANGREIAELPSDYGTAEFSLPSGWSYGDLTFGGPFPAANELMPPEQYMLAGTKPTSDRADDALPAWIDAVAEFCLDYHSTFNTVPTVLSSDVVTQLCQQQGRSLTAVDKTLSFNPLTGNAPRLDAQQQAPGDLYVRALTAEEMQYYAQRRPALYDAWYGGLTTDPATGRQSRVKLLTGVLYVRAYGSTGVVYENLVYRVSEPEYVQQVMAQTTRPAPMEQAWNLDGCDTTSG